MHRKSLTGEAKLNRDKAMLNDYIAGMHIAELAEKYGIGCTNVKKPLEVLEGFDAVRRNDRKSPNRKPNNQKRLSKADMEQRNIEIAQDYKNGAWTFEIAEKYNLSGQQVYHILRRSPDYTPHKENIGSAVQFKKRKRNAEIVADVRANPYMTVGEIMDKYGLSESTTYQVFREAGHPMIAFACGSGEVHTGCPECARNSLRKVMRAHYAKTARKPVVSVACPQIAALWHPDN